LSLYAILLLATPLLDWLLRRHGALVVLAVSASLFALAHAGGLGTHGTIWPFPVAYWQPLFVVGYVTSRRLSALCDSSGRIANWWLALVSVAFAVVFLFRNGASVGVVGSALLPDLSFVKVPLSPAELAWYLTASALVLTWSAWIWERDAWIRRVLGWLPLLGRQSLLVYMAHLFVQLVLIEALTLLEPSTSARVLMLPLTALILAAIATAGERWGRTSMPRRGSAPQLLRLLPSPVILGAAVMGGTFGAVVTLQLLVGTPAAWNLAAGGSAQIEVATTADGGAGIASAVDDDPYPEQILWLMDLEVDGNPGPFSAPEAVDPEAIESGT
jgi:peptidoglycan/LPS O-acetylase OafA/YrhL